jgi:hypothetical protein
MPSHPPIDGLGIAEGGDRPARILPPTAPRFWWFQVVSSLKSLTAENCRSGSCGVHVRYRIKTSEKKEEAMLRGRQRSPSAKEGSTQACGYAWSG